MKKKRVPPPPGCYICSYILFVVVPFIFGIFTSSFVFCILCSIFCLQKGFFPLLSSAFCILTFGYLLLSFVFKLLYTVFWFWVSSCYFYDEKCISVPLQILAADRHRDRQLIVHRIWEGGGNI